jgi:hypothetical protein
MKSTLDVLIERLDAGTWQAASKLECFNSPSQQDTSLPADNTEPVLLNRPVTEIEIASPDPVTLAVRSLLKPDEYIDEDGRIRKIQ